MTAIPAAIAAVYPEARIVPTTNRHPESGHIVIALDVVGLPLDRTMAYSWQLPSTDGKLAARLVEAAKDGKVYSLEKIGTDAFGKTYPVGTCIMGRHLHRELTRLGY
jgi:hypothetical protein